MPKTPPDRPYNSNPKQKLAVQIGKTAIDIFRQDGAPPNDFERELLVKVMTNLPGLPEPVIKVLLMPPKHPVELDAQNFANESGEPVCIVDMEGKVPAYRQPQ